MKQKNPEKKSVGDVEITQTKPIGIEWPEVSKKKWSKEERDAIDKIGKIINDPERRNNPRKGKRPLTLWMTKEEIKGLMSVINSENYLRRIGWEVYKINKRGDLEKR